MGQPKVQNTISSCGYLYLTQPLGSWMKNNPASSQKLVQKLELNWCLNPEEKIDDSIGNLVELTHFHISHSEYLKTIPTTIVAKLRKLEVLKFEFCVNLEELPSNLGDLKSLTHLSLINCPTIEYLPNSITELPKLIDLNLEGCCKSITELPKNLGDLVQLLHLRISGGRGIKSLPDSVNKLCNLQTLVLPYEFNLKTLTSFRLNDSVAVTVHNSPLSNVSWKEFRLKYSFVINGLFHLRYTGPPPPKVLPYRRFIMEPEEEEVSEEDSVGLTQGITNQKTSPLNLPVAGATKPAMKRKSDEFGRKSPSRGKQFHNAKKKAHEMESPSRSYSVEQNPTTGHRHVEECLDRENQHTQSDHVPIPSESSPVNNSSSSATTGTVKEPPMSIQCSTDAHQHYQEKQLDGLNQFTMSNGSSSSFVVKATYKEDTVRFNFSLTYNIDQLFEEVGKRFKLGMNKFKIKYQDEDKEWMLLTCALDLDYAFHFAKSCGTNFIRLFIIDL